MNTRADEAVEKYKNGYNCAQAVVCTYCDLVDGDEKTMFKATEALGIGMGNMEGTCGAVTAACILAGMKRSSGNTEKPDSKGETLRLSRKILNEFKEKNTTVVCKELKGIETGKVLFPCTECIREASRIAEKVLFEEN